MEPEGAPEEPQPEIPGLARRALDTFFSPGKVAEALAQKPVWAGALILGGLLVILQTALIPVEVWEATFREAALERGGDVPEAGQRAAQPQVAGVEGLRLHHGGGREAAGARGLLEDELGGVCVDAQRHGVHPAEVVEDELEDDDE